MDLLSILFVVIPFLLIVVTTLPQVYFSQNKCKSLHQKIYSIIVVSSVTSAIASLLCYFTYLWSTNTFPLISTQHHLNPNSNAQQSYMPTSMSTNSTAKVSEPKKSDLDIQNITSNEKKPNLFKHEEAPF